MRRQLDNVFATPFQSRSHLLPLGFVRNHLQTNQRERSPDAHHYVGMIDWLAVGTDAGEDNRLVTEILGKTLDNLRVGAIRERDVRNFVKMIKHENACLLECRVVDYLGDAIMFA